MTDEERFDIVDSKTGVPTGVTQPRSKVHREGLYHRAVHCWILDPLRGELLLQRRAKEKDSWPDRWDISCAGHLSAGDDSITAALREVEEELGVAFPVERFEYLFTHLEELSSTQGGKPFINNEFNNVYLITLSAAERVRLSATPPTAFALQASEVSAVQYFPWRAVREMYENTNGTSEIVPLSDWGSYSRLFDVVATRCSAST